VLHCWKQRRRRKKEEDWFRKVWHPHAYTTSTHLDRVNSGAEERLELAPVTIRVKSEKERERKRRILCQPMNPLLFILSRPIFLLQSTAMGKTKDSGRRCARSPCLKTPSDTTECAPTRQRDTGISPLVRKTSIVGRDGRRLKRQPTR
jgi:hypothetical protein